MILTQQHKERLAERMKRLGVQKCDLEEQFIRSSGPGGQHVNKVSSCVRLLHRPSGVEIRCQDSRSRSANRHVARVELCERLESKERQAKAEQGRKTFVRRMKAKAKTRSPRQKRLARKQKEHRSRNKQLRRQPRSGRGE